MNILLIDVDGLLPNLALMKISAYHKSLGHKVFFEQSCIPNEVYISCIFSWNKSKALGIAKLFPKSVVHVGGSGIDLKTELAHDIEHFCPDYELYKQRGKVIYSNFTRSERQFTGDIALGYTSRGCPRNCKFCIVPEKEGRIRDHACITEFIADKKKVRLLDNNFLASPKCEQNLNYIIDHKIQVCFDQGLDIRLVDEDNSKLLKSCKFYNRNFSYPKIYFAWDQMKDESAVIHGIKTLYNARFRKSNLCFYMLVGFDTTFFEDIYRFKTLLDLGVEPYVMIYNNKTSKVLQMFQRWVNGRIYKKCDFSEYR